MLRPGDTATVTLHQCVTAMPPYHGQYTFFTTSITDPTVTVYKPRGQWLAYNDDFNGLQSRISNLTLAAGSNYTVCVRGYASCCAGASVNIAFELDSVAPPALSTSPPMGSDGTYGSGQSDGGYGAYGGAGEGAKRARSAKMQCTRAGATTCWA